MKVDDFLHDLDTLLSGDRRDARIAAEDLAGDLVTWIEHLAFGSTALDRRRTQVAGQLLALRGRQPAPKGKALTLDLPPELIALCARDGVDPQVVLRGFIADLCGIMNWASNPRPDGYSSNGSDERHMAYAYYERVGYPYWNRP